MEVGEGRPLRGRGTTTTKGSPWWSGHPTTTLRATTAGEVSHNALSMSLSHSHMVTSVVCDILPVRGANSICNFPHVGGVGELGSKSAHAPYIQ